jgi:hypothetical protein
MMIRLRRAALVLLAALREIFDESAYARFLVQHRLTPNRTSYAAFQREYAAAKAQRPKCC